MATILNFIVATGEVLNVAYNRDATKFAGRDDILIDPTIPDAPLRKLKVVNRLVFLRSQTELDAIAAAESEGSSAEIDRQTKLAAARSYLTTLKGVDLTTPQIKEAVKALVAIELFK